MQLHKLADSEASSWLGCPLCKSLIDVFEVKTSSGIKWSVKCKNEQCIMKETKPVDNLQSLFYRWNNEIRMEELDAVISANIQEEQEKDIESLKTLTDYEKQFFKSQKDKLIIH